MSKIQITDLNNLIKQNYPYEVIKKLIDEVLLISMQVKYDYPDYKNWFLSKQVTGLYDNTRNIIIAHIVKAILFLFIPYTISIKYIYRLLLNPKNFK